MGKQTARAAEMRRVVAEYESSGQARREFCEGRGITLTTFDYWRRIHARRSKLVQVEVTAPEPGPGFTLSLANGRRIDCSWRFAEGELARLIRVAESA
jgi:hypothetical protein